MPDNTVMPDPASGAGRSHRRRLAIAAALVLAGVIAVGGAVYLLRPSGPPPLAPGAPAIPGAASPAP